MLNRFAPEQTNEYTQGITLNDEQAATLAEFTKFMHSAKRDFRLSGLAGSGKSTLVPFFIESIGKTNQVNDVLQASNRNIRNVAYCAPTHKAAKNLSQMVGEQVFTIHALFALTRGFDKDTGDEFYFKKKNNPLKFGDNTLVIVDEASMVSQDLLDVMDKNMPDNCKVLFLGDHIQLKPVNHNVSPVFENDYMMGSELTKPMRFNNSEIMDLNRLLRNAVINTKLPKIKPSVRVKVVDRPTFKEMAIDSARNGEDSKVVAWTNRRVNAFASLIHKELFGNKKYNVGQRMMAKSTFKNASDNLVNTQTEFEIQEEATTETIIINREPLEFIILETTAGRLRIPVNKTEAMKVIQPLKEKKQWREWYGFKDIFANVSNSYSITCHQSQSSTYDTVFIDLQDIMTNKRLDEMLRLLYVAASRARGQVIFCK